MVTKKSFVIPSDDTMRTYLRLDLGSILNILSTTKEHSSWTSGKTTASHGTHIFPSSLFRAGAMRGQCSLFSSCFITSSAIHFPKFCNDAYITDVIRATPVVSFVTLARDILYADPLCTSLISSR